MNLPSYEIEPFVTNADTTPYPYNALFVKLYDKSLEPALKAFVEKYRPSDFFLRSSTEEFDEYWIEYSYYVRKIHPLLNLWLWTQLRDMPYLRKLADRAAKNVGNSELIQMVDDAKGSYVLTFNVNDRTVNPFKIPHDIMDEAAANGQDYLANDVEELFEYFLIRYLMKDAEK